MRAIWAALGRKKVVCPSLQVVAICGFWDDCFYSSIATVVLSWWFILIILLSQRTDNSPNVLLYLSSCGVLIIPPDSSFIKYHRWSWPYRVSRIYLLSRWLDDSGEGNGTPLQYSCLEIPWTEEPGRLQSMGSQRVRHNWTTSLSHKWHPTPVLFPGKSHG